MMATFSIMYLLSQVPFYKGIMKKARRRATLTVCTHLFEVCVAESAARGNTSHWLKTYPQRLRVNGSAAISGKGDQS